MTAEAVYGIQLPDGQVLDPSLDHAEATARLDRYRDMWPDATLVQRNINPDWTPAPTAKRQQP